MSQGKTLNLTEALRQATFIERSARILRETMCMHADVVRQAQTPHLSIATPEQLNGNAGKPPNPQQQAAHMAAHMANVINVEFANLMSAAATFEKVMRVEPEEPAGGRIAKGD